MHSKTKQMENQTLTYEGLLFAQTLSDSYGEDVIEKVGYKAYKVGIDEVIWDFRQKTSDDTPVGLKSDIKDFCNARTEQIIDYLTAISAHHEK